MAKNEETRAVGDGAQLSSSLFTLTCDKNFRDTDSSDLDSLDYLLG
jgi:hypothetical protein